MTYVIARSGTGFKFHNGSEVFVDTTDVDGIAKQVYVRAGSVHGTYTGIVEASTTDGFQPIPDSPVEFTCHVKSLAHEIAKIDGDNSIGVVGSMVGPLKIQMLKTDGNPIGGQPVTFRGIAGGGSFDPETSSPKVDIVCDENGYATVYYWLGSEAGSNNNLVVAYTINVDDSISTVFRLSAKSSAADTMLALSPTTIQDVVAKPQIIQVQVKDVLENNVKGEEVVFTVTEGGGALNGSADPTAVEITDSSGVASVVWNLGTEAGTLNNVLEAVATDGISPINGAPVVFQASAGPDVVSMSRSTIDATNPVQAVPDSICHITVTLLDDYGNPVQGEVVEIDVDGEEWDIWQKTT
ncbi:hypothetical protein KA005_38300, partial [bacterium]|nr:hypothetical protein [bacterium]